jgi:hypothetical protein
MCGANKDDFELDHMTPWRHYIAALISEEYVRTVKVGTVSITQVRGDAAKALYNDVENLWWICHDCNNPKSDKIPETAAHASGDFSTGTSGRSAPKPSTFLSQ